MTHGNGKQEGGSTRSVKSGSKGVLRRQMLQKTGVATAIGLAGVPGLSQANKQELADELTVLTWGGSYGEAHESTIIRLFEEEYGVTVNHGVFGNDFDAIAKQKAGGGGQIDVVEPGMTGAIAGVLQDLYHPIRRENVPNLQNLEQQFQPENLTYDPGEQPHIVPWVWGTAGLVYNPDQLSSNPTNWADLFTEETRGNVAVNTVDWLELGPIEHAAFALGMGIGDFTPYQEKISPIWEKIREWKPYVLQWFSSGSTMRRLMVNQSIVAGVYWYGRFLAAQEAGAPFEFKIPEDGTSMWVDNWAVAKGTNRRYTAEQFLNFSLTQQAQRAFVNEFPYVPSINLDNPPQPLQDSPVPDNADRIHMADLGTLYEHRQDIQTQFQQIIRA